MFIRGETLSAHSARPRKIPGWIVVVREKFSLLNKRFEVFLKFLFLKWRVVFLTAFFFFCGALFFEVFEVARGRKFSGEQ